MFAARKTSRKNILGLRVEKHLKKVIQTDIVHLFVETCQTLKTTFHTGIVFAGLSITPKKKARKHFYTIAKRAFVGCREARVWWRNREYQRLRQRRQDLQIRRNYVMYNEIDL